MTKRQSTQSTLMVIYIGHFKVSTFFYYCANYINDLFWPMHFKMPTSLFVSIRFVY